MSKVCPTCQSTFADVHVFCPTDGTTLRANDLASGFVGTVIADRYVVTDLLGEGGMGKVYLAQHVKLPRQAAIKVLHPSMVQDPAAVARFNREASNASRIDHEGVARVFDYGETNDGMVYLAMEYITGRTLKRVLVEDAPLPLPRAVAIVRQIAEGLNAAHKLGIVHRDLKPDNIIVSRDDNGIDRCKIVDFGIAKAVGSGEKALTRTGFVIGTPEYMSPEQLMGEAIDHRSDIYALTLVAYECFAGELPFDNKTADRGMMARLTNTPRTVAELRPDRSWPVDIQGVLNKGLERQQANRYNSAVEFAAALEEAIKSPMTSRAPKTPPAAPAKAKPTTPPAAQKAPVAIPTPPRAPVRTPPRAHAAGQQPVIARTDPNMVAARPARRLRLPRIPIVRWATMALVVGFGWLVLTEGSVNRAFRRATGMARRAELNAKRLAASASTTAGSLTDTRDPAKPGAVGDANVGASGALPSGATIAGATTAVATTPPAAAEAPVVHSTREQIDSLASVMNADAASAGAVLSKLEALLPRATTTSDSAWALIRIAKAHHLMGANPAACTAATATRVLATSDAQKESLHAVETSASCAP